MPLTYVDNTYGTNAADDWSGGHTFDDLYSSDSLGSNDAKKGGIGFGWNGNTVRIDYLGGGSCDKKSAVCTSFRSGGLGAGSGLDNGITDKNDGAVISGTTTSTILAIATSLEYDLNLFAGLTTNSSTNSGWVKGVGYEIQFAGNTFNPATWLNSAAAATPIDLGTPHVSPPKLAFASYSAPTCIVGCPSPVPEPPSLAMLGAALAALGWAGRRRRRQAPATG